MRQTLSRCCWRHSSGAGVLAREKQTAHTVSAVGFLITVVALAMAVISLHLDEWSSLDNNHPLANHTVTGSFGLYHYEFTVRNVSQVVNGTIRVVNVSREGNINGRDETTLCNNLEYTLDGEDANGDGVRDTCDEMLDACSDASTFGIAAAVIGGFGTLWAAASTYTLDFHHAQSSESSEDQSRWRLCPRVSTGGIVFSAVAAIMAVVGCWSYLDQLPSSARFFLDEALDFDTPLDTNCTVLPNSTFTNATLIANCSGLEDVLSIQAHLNCRYNYTSGMFPVKVCTAECSCGSGYSCDIEIQHNSTVGNAKCRLNNPNLHLDDLDHSTAWVLMTLAAVVWLIAAGTLAIARCYKRFLNPMRNKQSLTRGLMDEYVQDGVYDERKQYEYEPDAIQRDPYAGIRLDDAHYLSDKGDDDSQQYQQLL